MQEYKKVGLIKALDGQIKKTIEIEKERKEKRQKERKEKR